MKIFAWVSRRFQGSHGSHHFLMQRLTALLLLPLVLWFSLSVAMLPEASYDEAMSWLRSPFNAILLSLFLVVGFYHAQLGIQMVLEDYVSRGRFRNMLIAGLRGVNILLALSSVYWVFKLSWEVT